MRPMLGTYVEIQVRDSDPDRAHHAIEAGFDAIAKVDALLSSHRPDSELNAINAAADEQMVAVSPWTHECLEASLLIAGQSDGAFDVTCRPLLDLWGFARKEYRLPTDGELRAALPLVDFHGLVLNRSRDGNRAGARHDHFWAGLARHGMKLDVGGIGKGFAVDKAVEAMRDAGATSGLVRAGGDLRGFGPRRWKVGIASPSHPTHAARIFEIENEAVSTSGDYENYFVVRGRRYGHIINPKTGWPVSRVHSFSVRAPTCTESDAWSTALFVNPGMKTPPSIHVADMR